MFGKSILTVHVLLLLEFYKSIAPWLPRIFVMNHFNGFDWAILLEFTSQLRLASIEINSRHKKSLKWIRSSFCGRVRIPKSDVLLQFIRNLFFLFSFLPL